MTYIELINEFWKQNGFMPFGAMDTTVYFYLLHQCNIRNWQNPFQLQTRNLEFDLKISRKQIGESKNRLKQRGLIDFTSGNRSKIPSYTIVGLSCDMFPAETKIETQIETQSETQVDTETETPYKTKTKSILDDNNIKSSSRASACTHSRTREEIQLERFDRLLQEIYSGNHRIWEDQMRKKHGIDSVREYLPSFRAHAIAASQIDSIISVNDLTRYFNNAFRYFSRENEYELLQKYLTTAERVDFRKYCEWVIEEAPNVARGIYPLSEEEFLNLKHDFGAELIGNAILNLNNREDLIKKYFSLYRTLINWCEKESAKYVG